ncbi:hypothetical protein JNJ66_03495 [Candidatus Saccharibacteria bacterium]|nr:hypothetical protein [Candidatus Saccharibacteria bacterium]
MDILWFYISADDKDFWAGVIGTIVSNLVTVLGIFIAAWLAHRHERRKTENEKLAVYSRACLRAEADLNNLLTMLYANVRLLQACTQHLADGAAMANLPRVTPINRELFAEFRNTELINTWLSLYQANSLVNNLVEDYRQYYARVTDEVHTMLLNGEKPEAKVIQDDYRTLQGFGGAVGRATEGCIERAFDTYALISVHANDGEMRFKRFKKLYEFRATEADLEAERAKLVKQFSPDDMFLDVK